jgi:hypothetical protein
MFISQSCGRLAQRAARAILVSSVFLLVVPSGFAAPSSGAATKKAPTSDSANAATSATKPSAAAENLISKLENIASSVDEVAKLRVGQRARADEIYTVMRLELHVDRMMRRIDQITHTPDANALQSLYDGLSRDLQMCSALVDALLKGNVDLGVEKATDAYAIKTLKDVHDQLARLTPGILAFIDQAR